MYTTRTLMLALAGCTGATIPTDPPVVVTDDTAVAVDSGHSTEVIPSTTSPWLRQETAAPGSITFTEIAYDSAQWIELHNPMAFDMDVSGWSLDGGVTYTFAQGTVIAARGYIVVAADPAMLADALGPYTGRLSSDGDGIELWNNGGRLIDTVGYGSDDPWPVEADGTGLTLAKIQADAASDHAENWTGSAEIGGTPGAANVLDPLEPPTTVTLVELEGTWAYDVSGSVATGWSTPTYDDSGWARADAIFYAGASVEDVSATAWVTADNYYGLYLGSADGSDLRVVGLDPDGDWTTADGFDLEVSPTDHLYVAAWEAPWDNGGPQMTIAEVEIGGELVGTDATTFEWILGPAGGCPGTTPTDPPPSEEELRALIADAAGTWALPGVEADRSSDPWGWALSGAFSAGTQFVWADTFSEVSATNTENTYVLLRSVEPLQGSRGTTELSAIPTTATFRAQFVLDADPASAELALQCVIDDGAVVYLNGVEVLRDNVPDGPVDADTLATSSVEESSLYADISSDALVRGSNVLAVEVHQAQLDDADLTFGCELTARILPDSGEPAVLFNEVAGAAEAPFWVELAGVRDMDGGVLVSDGGEMVVPAVAAGDLLVLDVDFPVALGDVLTLLSVDRSEVLDAVRVRDGLRGRDGGGPWRTPRESTPGSVNVVDVVDSIVINEVQYNRAEEWIELYNRGAEVVDLTDWMFVDAVAFSFPAGTVIEPGAYLVVASDAAVLQDAYPDIQVLGNFAGNLDNAGDHILLLDNSGNPADVVRYFDGGRWPSAADGGGSSLELRDPAADNAAAEAWAASAEQGRWVDYSTRGTADPSAVGPDGTWEELVLGLLDEGEVLIDDVSVIRDPDTNPVELVRNGSFDDAARWRLLGNHRHSEVVSDPDDPSNGVLRLVATGPTGHMHNHAETTLAAPIQAVEHEVSFRARWVSGSNQLNSRLYFNRLPFTTLVEQAATSGTPGAPNSVRTENIGPTFTGMRQDVAVPAPYAPVGVSIGVDDPDGVQAVTLWSSVAGAAFTAEAMTESSTGEWTADLPGQAAGTIVQFYVEAEDADGATALFPAAGPDSRALVTFADDAAENGLHNFRILITEADSDWLHDDVNLMSDDLIGATVVYDEREVFYDVGLRTKGSERGRPEVPRLGYGVRFNSEQPFRGSHSSVLIDRSEGVGYGQREVLHNLVMTAAGSVSGEYNDLTHVITPLPEHTGAAELQLDRFSDLVLASQFEGGDGGALFEYELIYYPLTTDDGTAEGLKLPAPDYVVGTAITDLGDDREAYRWNFMLQNNERLDDYSGIMTLGQTFGGADFLGQVPEVIDVDQWLRAFAFATLSGAVDNYGSDGSQHNARFYVRPEDGKVLYFPHDLDFFGGSTMSVIGNGDLARLIANPDYERLYYGHLQDIIGRAYNATYLAPWCTQFATLLSGQDIGGHCSFIQDRAEWVMNGSPDSVAARFPSVDFRITTNGGADVETDATEIDLEGEGWIDVRGITYDGDPLTVTWSGQAWQVTVPLVAGPNDIVLVATDVRGDTVATDTIVITSGG